jgi:hypothetical protein
MGLIEVIISLIYRIISSNYKNEREWERERGGEVKQYIKII